MDSLKTLKELIEKRNSIIKNVEQKIDSVNKAFQKSKCGLIAEIFDSKTLTIAIKIEWGDWKHEHGYADYVMQKHGFKKVYEQVTDNDESDCYSSIHFYHL